MDSKHSLEPIIKFTIRVESDNVDKFCLYLTVTKIIIKPEFSIFIKPSHTDIILPNSKQHREIKSYPLITSIKNFVLTKQITDNNGYCAFLGENVYIKTFQFSMKWIYLFDINDVKIFHTLT